MKKRYSTACLTAILVMLMNSCENILEQEPKNSTYADAFWQSSRDLSSALAGNYALLRDAMASGSFNTSPRWFMYGDAVAKNYFTIQYAGDGLEGIQSGDFTFQYNIESLGNWTRYFKVIAMCNTILKHVPEVPGELLLDVSNPDRFKNEIIGETLFIRALTYFMMVRVWGDVPLVLEEYEDPISAPNVPRNPKTEVMAQIEADCHQAASLLSWSYSSTGEAKVTANRGSVYALLAHLYLWRATTTDVTTNEPLMQDVLSADTAITALIANGGYHLTDTSSYYNTFIGRSPEGIFEINISENQLEGSNSHIANMFLRTDQIDYYGTNSRCYVNTSYLTNHFYKNVTEWGWVWNNETAQWEWKEIAGRQLDPADIRYRRNFTDINTDLPTCIKYSNVVYRNPGQLLDAYVSNNMIVFRLSDMMLLQAEIELYKDNPDAAVDIINFFRKRNGASPDAMLSHGMTRDQVMYEYMLERGKELYLEGHLYYDLIRTRQYPNFIDWLSEPRFRREGFYWPVDPALFRNNNLLTQTSYWRGKV